MASVPTGPVRAHIADLGMTTAELATRSGLATSTIRGMLRQPTTRASSAAAVLAVRKPEPHPTTITHEGRVSCGCGFRSQRFGTLGLAKARERTHRETGS
jgi:lambda repressor-like predicted transcriptional regulator